MAEDSGSTRSGSKGKARKFHFEVLACGLILHWKTGHCVLGSRYRLLLFKSVRYAIGKVNVRLEPAGAEACQTTRLTSGTFLNSSGSDALRAPS